MIPYPNPELIEHLRCSIDLDILCDIRDTLFSHSNAYGSEEGEGLRLTRGQLRSLDNGLTSAYGHLPRFEMDALVACKIVVGRWLRPREMIALFELEGQDKSMYRKRFSLAEGKGDQKVNVSSGRDERISYAIGKAGNSLNRITKGSNSFYIWFNTINRQPTVVVYAQSSGSIEHARALINKHMAGFKGRGVNKKGFSVRFKGGEPDRVSLHAMYKDLRD